MNFITKLLSIAILICTIILVIILFANNGFLNKPISYGLQRYFSTLGINIAFSDFGLDNYAIKFSKLDIKYKDNLITFGESQLGLSFLPNFRFFIKLFPSDLKIFDKNSKQIIQTSISGSINYNGHKDIKLFLSKINLTEQIKDTEQEELKNGIGYFIYLEKSNTLDINLQFNKRVSLKLSSLKENSNILKLQAQNIPVLLYNIVDRILPNSYLLELLRSSFQGGHIKDANIIFNLKTDDTISKSDLYGTAKVIGLNYKYDNYYRDSNLPILKSMDIDIKISGTKAIFNLNSAYSSEILLSNGIIELDWKGIDNTIIYINVIGKGPARSLTDFIPEKKYAAMNQADINLRKMKGEIDANIHIAVPLKPGTKTSYDIKTKISNVSLNIFKNYIKFNKAQIWGTFDGKHLKLNGIGKLNSFKSELDFIYNIQDDLEFSHKLNIRTYLKARLNEEKKIAFIKFPTGDSIVGLNYLNKNHQSYIKIDSDISNLELDFDKLGIRKKKDTPARIKIDGTFQSPDSGTINFHTYNHQDLSIKGVAKIKNGKTLIKLDEIKNKKTNISGEISLFNDEVIAVFQGDTLDLSDTDMLQFLEKERQGGSSKLQVNIDKVQLKNNILLNNLSLMFECDNTRCFSGYINSKIGTKDITVLLTAENNREKWLVKCSNAGSLLKGIGAYNFMNSGTVLLHISTSRKEIKPGQIIPVLDGTFSFIGFSIQNAPTISRLLSMVSVPGLIGIISSNKDIAFSEMKGNFNFVDNILKINHSFADGLYFNFSLRGSVNIKSKLLNLKGHVLPSLYGLSTIINSVPLIGRIVTGSKKNRGLLSITYDTNNKEIPW